MALRVSSVRLDSSPLPFTLMRIMGVMQMVMSTASQAVREKKNKNRKRERA